MSGKLDQNDGVSDGSTPDQKQASPSTLVQNSKEGPSSKQVDSMMALSSLSSLEVSPGSSSQALSKSITEDKLSLAEQDRRHLLTIFSEQIWSRILKNFVNSPDLENLSNSSLYFRELLLPQRTQFLFHNVWNILGKAFERNYFSRGNMYEFGISTEPSGNNGDNELATDGIVDWFQEILELRFVCRTWNSAIENYYQNHPIHFCLECEGEKNQEIIRDLIQLNIFQTMGRIRGLGNLFFVCFAQTHDPTDNPFLGRSAQIAFEEGPENQFFAEILLVLKAFGHHLWYSFIHIFDFKSRPECYSRIRQVMQLLPNLKVLRIGYFNSKGRMSATERQQLQAEIRLNPLPTLRNLQMLTTTNLIPTMCNELIRRNGHVSILDVGRYDTSYSYNIFNTPLQNLTTLVVSLYSEEALLKINRDSVTWQLTVLHLDLKRSKTFIEWQTVFNVLERKFQNTLTKLNLRLPEAKDKMAKDRMFREGHNIKLNLPLLTELRLKMKNLACLDFLLPMKNSLTKLNLKYTLADEKNVSSSFEKVESGEMKVVKFLSCMTPRRPLETNVWNVFPKLTDFVLRVKSNKTRREIWSDSRNG